MRDCMIILGDAIQKNVWGYKECCSKNRFHFKSNIRSFKKTIDEYCKKYSCSCAELVFFNSDCTVKCWFISDHGNIEKFE